MKPRKPRVTNRAHDPGPSTRELPDLPAPRWNRQVRCRSCWDWVSERDAHIAACPACFWSTARCGKATCGGAPGAMRSLRAHFSYWAGARGKEGGGHAAALAQAVRSAITAWKKRWTKGE